MSEQHPSASSEAAKADRRRSQRVFLVVAVHVAWKGPDGARLEERGETGIVSGHGAVVRMRQAPPLGADIEVRTARSDHWVSASVVDAREPGRDGRASIALELAVPEENFWGVPLPPPPIYNFRVNARPENASLIADLLEKIRDRKVHGKLVLQVNCERPLPPDLWREVEELLEDADLSYDKNV